MRYICLILLFLVNGLAGRLNAQELDVLSPTVKKERTSLRKGSVYFYWGYNREWFTVSDISFKSAHSNFTLSSVKAKDRQSNFGLKNYIYNITIPQFNVRLGYLITDHFGISFGQDHMKYVVVQKQRVTINGIIDTVAGQEKYAGIYKDASIKIDSPFLRYEHTNGLNYISLDGEYYRELWHRTGHSQSIGLVSGLSLGLLYPRSDIDVYDVEGVNIFHTAGFGLSGMLNLRVQVCKPVFFMFQNRFGEIILNDILISDGFKAKQHFGFYQTAFLLGVNFNLWHF